MPLTEDVVKNSKKCTKTLFDFKHLKSPRVGQSAELCMPNISAHVHIIYVSRDLYDEFHCQTITWVTNLGVGPALVQVYYSGSYAGVMILFCLRRSQQNMVLNFFGFL
jgi:hypothetical protein